LERKGAAEVKIATIHYKPTASFRPDYFVMTTTSWIAYPWERYEMERELKKG
jgi:hypoxanthine phosphoribosyltransferase